MKDILITIIIPVYRVECYLRECIDSILTQSYANLEVILIDDGSPDSSPQICDQYARQDSRIKVIHKSNGGASDARNYGLREATGEYILFVDSDDTLGDREAISQAVEILSSNPTIDTLLFGFTYVTNRGSYTLPPLDASRINGHPKADALAYLISEDRFDSATCSKFIRREIISQNNISFIKGIRSEDYDWTMNIILHSRTLHIMASNFYHYRLWDGSVSSAMSTQHLLDIWGIITSWHARLSETKIDETQRDLILDYLAYIYGFLMSRLYLIPSRESRDNLTSQMKQYSTLLTRKRSRKVRQISILYRVLGFSLTCKLMGAIVRMRR